MANTQAQFGFKHIGFISGSAPDYQLSTRSIRSAYASAIFFGDPVVKSTGTNYIRQPADNTTLPVDGVFQGCWYVPSGGGAPVYSPYFPGSVNSDATAYVVDAPGALFLAASLLTSVTGSSINSNIGWSTGAGGATTGGAFSSYVVDSATATAQNSWPFRVVSYYQGIGNGSDTTTNYNWVVVTFNNHRFKQLTGVA